MSLGEVFRRSREQRPLSQRELAARAQLSPSHITRLERDLANPTWQVIRCQADRAAAGTTRQPRFPTPAEDLRILVHDTDEGLLALQHVLLGQQLLFDELDPEELRPLVQRSWPC